MDADVRDELVEPLEPPGLADLIQRECTYRDEFTGDAERALSIALFVPWCNSRRPHRALGVSRRRAG